MACGLPIIGVDKLAVPCIVNHGKNGLISKAHHIDDMAKNMINLLENKKKRAQFSKGAIASIQNYSLDKTAKNLESLYASLLKKKA